MGPPSILALPCNFKPVLHVPQPALLLMPGNHRLEQVKDPCGLCPSLSFYKNGPHCRDLFKHKLQNLSRKVGAVTFHNHTEIKPSEFKIPHSYQLGKNVPTLDDSRAKGNLKECQVQPLVTQMRKDRARETCSET